ncbi:BolA family protein [Lichenicola sp.]|uniref:BolA family protein n=1 Tax=Lichenicola sp. TaxID=2804529 RepID=UPI003B0086A0
MTEMPVADRAARMRAAMMERFHPELLEISDESARHAGHAGMRERGPAGVGETHYAMLLVSEAFQGSSRVQRSRLVHEALGPEFRSGLHALSLTLRTPAEHREHPRHA